MKRLVTDTASVLAFATAYVYIFAFIYERARAAFYGIPPEFALVGLRSILHAAAAGLVIFIVAFVLCGLLVPLFRLLNDDSKRDYHFIIASNLVWLVLGIIVAAVHSFDPSAVLWIVGTILLFNLVRIGPALVFSKRGVPFSKRIKGAAADSDPLNIFNYFAERYGFRVSMLVFIMVMGIPFAMMLGERAAMNQREYWSLETDSVESLILTYNSADYIFFGELDADKKLRPNKIHVRRLEGEGSWALKKLTFKKGLKRGDAEHE